MSTTTPDGTHTPPGPQRFRANPGNMLRAGLAEAVGTFFLIYTGTATAGAGALGKATAGSPPDSLAVALAFGLVLAALVGALDQVSGAHLNGAVTLRLAVAGKFPWRYVPVYLLFQLAGAIAGAGATWATFGSVVRDQATSAPPSPLTGLPTPARSSSKPSSPSCWSLSSWPWPPTPGSRPRWPPPRSGSRWSPPS